MSGESREEEVTGDEEIKEPRTQGNRWLTQVVEKTLRMMTEHGREKDMR